MPIYEYEPDSGSCEQCGGRFEAIQAFSAEPLKQCPDCQQPCHRVLSTFAVTGQDILSSKSLESKGFTQYKKAGDGYYEKSFGDGPNSIRRD